MDDLRSWLTSHGLGMYCDVFLENDLTLELLPELDQSDLRELGLSLGHRKIFLKHVRHLASDHPGALAQQTNPPNEPPAPLDQLDTSERRQLTIMFCDLVDSTGLGRQIGAEDMQDLLRSYQDLCFEAVSRYNGYIARYLGDGILAYFGFPQAHEQDADRAVRTALALIELIKQLDEDYQSRYGVKVQVRVGIATGPVVVGDIVGAGAAAENTVVGEAPNLAARIQSVAAANTVAVSNTTHRLCQYAFHFEEQGHHHIKGLSEPEQVWRAVTEKQQTSRFRATRPQGLTSLIGRSEELQILLSRWSKVKQGEGQIINVSGEAGIGKSHLIEAFLEQADFDESRAILFQCSPYHTGSVLHPVIEQLHTAITNHGENKATLNKLGQYLNKQSEFHADAVQYFARQLSLECASTDMIDDVLPQTLRQRAFSGWCDTIIDNATHAPMIAVLEDAHWLDATSIELFSELIKRIHQIPLLLVITARPEFMAPWKNHRCPATPLVLDRMQKSHGREIIQKIANQHSVPESLINIVLEKTDGVPLFVEELTKSLIDSGMLDNSEISTEAFDIPETLHDLLMSRVDKSPSIKNILQIGSAIGRDFAFQLLATVASEDQSDLQRLIKTVVDSEVVFESGVLPSSVYTFRHALIQDAAYQSLLLRNRRILHKKIANALETQDNTTVSDEVIAYHWSQAGESEKAATYWHRAARYATSVWANAEATRRYNLALGELVKTKESPSRNKQELLLLLELGDALRAASGSSATDTISAFNKATTLCQSFDDSELFIRAHYGAFTAYFTSARLDLACSVAQVLMETATLKNNPTGLAAGLQALGMHQFATGNFARAQQHFEAALTYQGTLQANFDFQFPVLSQSYLSWTLFLTDKHEQAIELMSQAIIESKSVSTYNYALAMANACYLHQFNNDTSALADLTSTLKVFATEKGFPVWYAVAEFFDCWQRCQSDYTNHSAEQLISALDFWAEDEIETPYFKSITARCLTGTDYDSIAQTLKSQAQTLMDETGEVWYEQWHRLGDEP